MTCICPSSRDRLGRGSTPLLPSNRRDMRWNYGPGLCCRRQPWDSASAVHASAVHDCEAMGKHSHSYSVTEYI
jgi:hypothetical protein